MGFAQAGAAVNKQGVVGVGWVLGNGMAGCVGKFIGGTNNKGREGVLVLPALAALFYLFPAVGGKGDISQLRFLFYRFFAIYNNVYVKPKHILKSSVQQAGIFLFNYFLLKGRSDVKYSSCAVKTDRFNIRYPKLIRKFGNFFGMLTVFLYQLQNFIKRLHGLYPSAFPIKNKRKSLFHSFKQLLYRQINAVLTKPQVALKQRVKNMECL